MLLDLYQAKQTKTVPGPNLTRRAIHFGQGLFVDFAFNSVITKNLKQCEDYVGVNGETCCILVTDHFTEM